MKTIPLTQGKVALVDDLDYEPLAALDCHATTERNGQRYAASQIAGKTILMHRFIMDAKKGQRVDHWNRNGLDNQRKNLRFCSQSQNIANSGIRSNTSSGLKGVRFHKGAQKWTAYLCHKYLGLFPTKELAREAYDRAIQKSFGDFALTNQSLLTK